MRLKLPWIATLALWIIALLLLWHIMRSPALLEALFLFLTAGEVPGTNIRLSPDAVLGALPFVFAGIVIAIFNVEFRRLIGCIVRAFRHGPAPETTVLYDESDVALQAVFAPDEPAKVPHPHPAAAIEPLAAVAYTAPREPSKLMAWLSVAAIAVTAFWGRLLKRHMPALKRARTYIRRQSHRLLIAVIPHLDTAAYYTGYGLGRAKHYALQAWSASRTFARLAWKVIVVELSHALQVSRAAAIRFWRWASPYFWQLDTWLGIKLERLLRHPYIRHGRHVVQDVKRDIIRFFKK